MKDFTKEERRKLQRLRIRLRTVTDAEERQAIEAEIKKMFIEICRPETSSMLPDGAEVRG